MAQLAESHYGKSRVRLLKVVRAEEDHEVREWTIEVSLDGDLEACFRDGDNSGVMATDTMKNLVYSVARESTALTMEEYAQDLARVLTQTNPQVKALRLTLEEKMWVRIRAVQGEQRTPHPSAFLQRGPEMATAELRMAAGGAPVIASGVKGLVILKTAHSAFRGFQRDPWTTLPDTDDRLLGTEATIVWTYNKPLPDYTRPRRLLLDRLLTSFAEHESLSVQQTLFQMAEDALAAMPDIDEIALTMPNRHNLLVNLSPFGQTNPNQVFVPTDEPYGHIFARVTR